MPKTSVMFALEPVSSVVQENAHVASLSPALDADAFLLELFHLYK